jgi:glycosyltransferase involved in cell wall biosynthesis
VTTRRRIAFYYNVGWGGGRRWLYECASRLSDYHDLSFYCIDRQPDTPHYPDIRDFAAELHAVPFSEVPRHTGLLKPLQGVRAWIDLLRFDAASRDVAAQIDAAGYDLMFASVGGYTEAPLPLRHARTRSAYYCHEPMRMLYEPQVPRPYTSRRRKLWNRAFYGTLVRRWDREGTLRANSVIANSRYCADYASRAYGVTASVNYPGVDTDAFKPSDEQREKFVLTVGELLPSKGFDWAIRAVGSISEAARPPLVIVANRAQSDEAAYLQAVADECGVRLEIRERLADHELKSLLRRASAFIYTPHLEPFGLAPVEAMASGTPVVVVNEAGPRETVVDGETGFVCERDPVQLGECLGRLLDDARLRQRLGSAARDHVLANFKWERSVQELAGMLDEAAHVQREHRVQPAPIVAADGRGESA